VGHEVFERIVDHYVRRTVSGEVVVEGGVGEKFFGRPSLFRQVKNPPLEKCRQKITTRRRKTWFKVLNRKDSRQGTRKDRHKEDQLCSNSWREYSSSGKPGSKKDESKKKTKTAGRENQGIIGKHSYVQERLAGPV